MRKGATKLGKKSQKPKTWGKDQKRKVTAVSWLIRNIPQNTSRERRALPRLGYLRNWGDGGGEAPGLQPMWGKY